MLGTIPETIFSFLSELSTGDRIRILDVLIPVLKEQEKEAEKRNRISRKVLLDRGYHFGSKNYEGSDIFRNAVRLRLADYAAGVSVKETILVPEGWYLVEEIIESLRRGDLHIRAGGLILTKVEDLCRISYGIYYVDVPSEERMKMAIAIDRKLYYRNDELGILVRDDGSVYLFTNLDGGRVYVKEPHRLYIFLRASL